MTLLTAMGSQLDDKVVYLAVRKKGGFVPTFKKKSRGKCPGQLETHLTVLCERGNLDNL